MKLSIITVNLNDAAGLRKTIESVVSQAFTDYEFIVIDGGSTDGSVDIIKQYADKINYWESEPDRGIYHAMNKGIMRAKGEYCQFLNSGDWIIKNDGLQQIFDKKPDEDILYCDAHLGNEKRVYPDSLNLLFFIESTITHQAAFIKRSLFKTFGLYDEEIKIVSDWEFWLKTIIKGQCSYRHIPLFLVYFDVNGISWTSHYHIVLLEKEKILKDYYPEMCDVFKELILLREELNFYKYSKPIQLVKKVQLSGFYKKIKMIVKKKST